MANDLDRSYQWAINTCNAPNIGYSQLYRNQQTVNGITYYDCSSFVWYALMNGDFQGIGSWGSWPFVTYDIDSILTAAGWNRLTAYDNKWLSGDVVLGKWDTITLPNGQQITGFQHVEMCYEGTEQPGQGYLMGAHGARGRALPDQVSIKTTLDYGVNGHDPGKYTYLYRWGEGGATGYGLTLAQVAALCGNAWRESTVNPGSDGYSVPQDHARGLWSWTDYEGLFYAGTAMINWMTDHGYQDWINGNAQVQCLLEDNLPAPYENPANPGSKWLRTGISEFAYTNAQYPDWNSWKESPDKNDIEEMTREFFLHWEVPSTLAVYNMTWQYRLDFARKAAAYIQEHANDTTITDWIIKRLPGSIYLTEAEALNNCVMIWRYASAGGGGGGLPNRKVGMPLWMMIKYRR